MKIFLLISFIFVSQFALGKCPADTITNWQIYYGKKLISAGNENQYRVPMVAKIFVTDKNEKLLIHYGYDFAKPEWRAVIIKSDNKILFEGTQQLKDNHSMPINLKEILDKKGEKLFKIQIYYTDNITPEKNRFISEIEIKTK